MLARLAKMMTVNFKMRANTNVSKARHHEVGSKWRKIIKYLYKRMRVCGFKLYMTVNDRFLSTLAFKKNDVFAFNKLF